jgi:hypothetical protein
MRGMHFESNELLYSNKNVCLKSFLKNQIARLSLVAKFLVLSTALPFQVEPRGTNCSAKSSSHLRKYSDYAEGLQRAKKKENNQSAGKPRKVQLCIQRDFVCAAVSN